MRYLQRSWLLAGYGAEEMMVYEDVSLYQPPTGQYRPIVLVGG